MNDDNDENTNLNRKKSRLRFLNPDPLNHQGNGPPDTETPEWSKQGGKERKQFSGYSTGFSVPLYIQAYTNGDRLYN